MTAALAGFAAMLTLTFLRVPIAFAMAIVGFGGLGFLRGWPSAFSMAGAVAYESGFQYTLSVVPLFILMGNFVTRAGMSRELYALSYAFLGHLRGGLAMATILACAGFGAICGSSLATAATFAKVAMPEMKRFGYEPGFAAGSIAAGGTLGILIPPSVIMVIYCLLTEQNIGAMFAAGFLPGLVAIACYIGAIVYATWRNPAAGPPGERLDWVRRLAALKDVWAVLVLFSMVMGGIYGGVFTPTEAAGIGAFGGFLFAWARGGLDRAGLLAVLVESARTTAMLFVILIGALIFANFINFTSMPDDLKTFVAAFGIHPIAVVIAICGIYILLGCVLESLSMVLLTVPVFYPLVQHLGFDLIWFGIIVVVVTEISLITPPVGMNVFVLRTLLPEVPTSAVFRGVTPFIVADFVRLSILLAFPAVSLFLPKLFF